MATPDIIVQVKGGSTKVISAPTGTATKLVELSDVDATPVANGDVLTYVSANSKFEFHPGSSPGGNAFGVVNVAGQSNVVADSTTDTLTLIAGAGIVITTDAAGDNVTIASTGGAATDDYARAQANGAFDRANAAYANANTAIYTAAQIRANISNTAPINYEPTTGVISHALSGATASGYGDAATVAKVVVDSNGHVTSVTNTSIAISAAAITSGTLAVARGGTGQTAITVNGSLLIGNTVSGGFDVNTLTQGVGVLITNDKGSITVESSVGKTYYFENGTLSDVGVNHRLLTAPSTLAENTISFAATGTLSYTLVSSFITANGEPNVTLLPAGTYGRHIYATTGASNQVGRLRVEVYKYASNTLETLLQTADSPDFWSGNENSLLTWNLTNTVGYPVDPTDRILVKWQAARVSGPATCNIDIFTQGNTRASYTTTTILGTSGTTVTSVAGRTGAVVLNTNDVTENVAGPFYHTAARVRGNVTNTAPINYDSTTGTFSHADSGAAASGYGDAATVAKVVVDVKGHVTSVVNTAIAISAAAITSGTLAVGRGGTGQTAASLVNGAVLIGNTVSGGYDLNTLTEGTGIDIVNDKGSITISATGGSAIDQYARDKANGAAQQAFITLVVSGQSDIVADSNADTLTVVAGSGIILTTDAGTDTLTISATGGAATDQYARDKANGAVQTGFTIYAVSGQSNIVPDSNTDTITIAGTGITITTDAGTDTLTFTHPTSGVSATGYGDAATVPKIVVDDKGHATSITNTAIAISAAAITSGILSVARGGTGKDATGLVNGALLIGNTVNSGFDLITVAQTAPIIVTNGKGTVTLSHASSGVVASGYGDAATVPKVVVDSAGHVTSVTNTAIAGLDAGVITTGTLVVARGGTGQSSYTNGQILIGNTGSTGLDKSTLTATSPITSTVAQGSITLTHDISGVAAAGYGDAATVAKVVVDDKGHVTSVVNTAIAISAAAITSGTLVVARGGTGQSSYTNGQILIGNTGSTGLDKTTISQSAPVIVTNLQGSITISHARSGVVESGYGTAAQIPVFVVDANGHVTSVTNTAVTGLSTDTLTSGILSVARGGTGKDATGLVNGALLIGNTVNSGFDLITIAQTAPIIVTNGKGTVTLSHASSGVTASGYGDAATVPKVVVDSAGHVTSVTNTAIAGLDAGVITTGTLVVARGGTGQSSYTNGQILIGNTGSTGLDKTTISQSAPVIVTNLQGSITVSHARSGVVAATYGSQSLVPVFVVDANGHLTSVTDTTIGGLAASAITSGVLIQAQGGTGFSGATANGQLLIGNTVSGGFDRATLTQGSNITITNLKGSIEIASTGGGGSGFGDIQVSGQDSIVADQANDVLTLVAGSGISLTTVAGTDTLTITATGGASTDQFARDTANGAFTKANGAVQTAFVTMNVAKYNVGAYRDVVSDSNTDTLTLTSGRGILITTLSNTDTLYVNATCDLQVSMNSAILGTNTWTTRTSTADITWQSIAWSPELGLFAAVASDGAGNNGCMTSPDGIIWTTRSVPDLTWQSIAWSPQLGLFAAVAVTAATGIENVITSSNGIVWTVRTGASLNQWRDITWSAELGLFAAVSSNGSGNRVMTSPNGIDWTPRTSGADNQWYGIAWSRELNLFAAVANTGTNDRVMTSPNGTDWATRTSAADVEWQSIAWSPQLALFAAVSQTGTDNRVMTSPDGVVWTTRTGAGDIEWQSITWSAELSLFIAVAKTGTGTRIMSSGDGINWAPKLSASDNNWNGVSWSPELGLFASVAASGTGTRVMTSKKMGLWRTVEYAQLHANAAFNHANGGFSHANGAFNHANGSFSHANGAFTKANDAIYTAAQIRANISATTPISYDSGTGIISHATSGASASGYGDAATIPVLVVNATGHLTAVTNTAIAIAASAITSGVLIQAQGGTGFSGATANGQLLIGNTVSGGFDRSTLTQGTNITITNLKGSITIDALDVYARDQANGAFNHANGSFNHANGAFTAANAASTIGVHSMWVPAFAMYPAITNGASAANGSFETGTNDQVMKTLDFDTSTAEAAQFAIKMPKSWNAGTVNAIVVWGHGTTTTNFGVTWQFDAVAFGDNEALDTAFGAAIEVSDTGGTTNNVYISAQSGAITVGSIPAKENWVFFRVRRAVANSNDNLAIDARLHGVEIKYTIDASTDA